MSVRGTKKRIFDTKDYGMQAFYCYEMASPIFGDIGKATISDDGTCLIDLDDIFQESINAEITYYVFLQKESDGDCWVEEKAPTHFVVEGTPGLEFSFEIKAMQTNYEHMRFADASETAYDRIAFTYSEVDEKTGNIISQNNKGNFLVMNTEVQGHLDAIKEYIATAHLK